MEMYSKGSSSSSVAAAKAALLGPASSPQPTTSSFTTTNFSTRLKLSLSRIFHLTYPYLQTLVEHRECPVHNCCICACVFYVTRFDPSSRRIASTFLLVCLSIVFKLFIWIQETVRCLFLSTDTIKTSLLEQGD